MPHLTNNILRYYMMRWTLQKEHFCSTAHCSPRQLRKRREGGIVVLNADFKTFLFLEFLKIKTFEIPTNPISHPINTPHFSQTKTHTKDFFVQTLQKSFFIAKLCVSSKSKQLFWKLFSWSKKNPWKISIFLEDHFLITYFFTHASDQVGFNLWPSVREI